MKDTSDISHTKMRPEERRVVWLTSWAHSINHMPELALFALLPLIGSHFIANDTTLGIVAAGGALASGVTAPLGGMLADKIGSRKVLIIYGFTTGILCLVVAASNSVLMLGISFTLLGLALGLYHPVGLTFISRTVRAHSMAFGYHGIAGNIGQAIAPAMAAFLAGLFNWRAGFVVLGFIALSVAISVMLSKAKDPVGKNIPTVSKTASTNLERKFIVPLTVVFLISILGGFVYRGAFTFMPRHYEINLEYSIFNKCRYRGSAKWFNLRKRGFFKKNKW